MVVVRPRFHKAALKPDPDIERLAVHVIEAAIGLVRQLIIDECFRLFQSRIVFCKFVAFRLSSSQIGNLGFARRGGRGHLDAWTQCLT